MNAYEAHQETVRAYARECSDAGREVVTAKGAAALFGVEPGTVRVAKSQGHISPLFSLGVRDAIPLYWLDTLQRHFSKREPDPALLAKMRENGLTCYVSNSDGRSGVGWLLLCERPGLESWEEAAAS